MPLLEKSKQMLMSMKIPILEPPDGVDAILNMQAEQIASIDDMDLANVMQYKIAQLIAYVEQQYRIVNSSFNERNEYLVENWNRIAANIDIKASLTEKKAMALTSNQRLQEVKKEVDELRMQKELIEGWGEKLQGLSDVIKQVHYRLRHRDLGS